jgi:hypothetical protein
MSAILANVSSRLRIGCKGPAAERWLSEQGIGVPAGANRFSLDARGLLSARLATSEFLFEAMLDEAGATLAPAKRALELAEMPSGVYPVLRQDFVIELRGPEAHDLFAQTCAVDLVPIERDSTASGGPIVLTSMIGVGVVIACRPAAEGARFTIWSDPSYSHYFWNQLLAIATDLGGGADPAAPTRSGGTQS